MSAGSQGPRGESMLSGRLLAVAAAILLALSAAACTHADLSDSKKTTPTPTPTAVVIPRARLDHLQDDLGSGERQRVRRAVELPPGVRLEPSFIDSLDGLSFEFDASSAVEAGPGQVAIAAVVTDAAGTVTRWQVTLDRIHGEYLIADTRPVP